MTQSMLIYFRCSTCKASYAVSANDKKLDLLTVGMSCPGKNGLKKKSRAAAIAAWGCPGQLRGARKWDPEMIILKAQELFQATSGMGLPDEKNCIPKNLRKLLIGKKIEDLMMGPGPGKRAMVQSITVEGGVTIHLATSTKGVTIYKVTKEGA